jgi:Spy/CpxP family protein refolding chaperone
MKLTAIVLASAFAMSSTYAFAATMRDRSNVTAHPMYVDAGPTVALHPKYGKPYGNFGETGNRDVWGHLGAYYGPMISTGAGR